jgi:hypothetical protein
LVPPLGVILLLQFTLLLSAIAVTDVDGTATVADTAIPVATSASTKAITVAASVAAFSCLC